MTRDDIIRMAREAGMAYYWRTGEITYIEKLERFAALVEDAQAKRMHNEGFVTVGHMRQQIAAEREAVASMVEDWDSDGPDPRDIAASIRARGQA
jgi:hypothetical protein